MGYIVANHQSFNTHPSNYVFTYYKALNTLSASEERKKLYVKSIQDIHKDILAEMKTIYPDIEKYILDIEIKKLGHGMISPKPGLIHSPELGVFNKPYGNIYFAHSDFCGISIFEEAFARGIAIAKQTISA